MFFHTTKKSGQEYKYFNNKKSFNHEIKNIFHHFIKEFHRRKEKKNYWKVRAQLQYAVT